MDRRDFHRAALATAAFAAAPALTRAQGAAKPIKLMVGFAPGGSSDVVARALGQRLSTVLGQPVIVDNRPGAGGRTVLGALKAAPPDGLHLLLTPGTHLTLSPWLYPPATLGYDPVKDFTPIARVARMDFGVMVRAQPGGIGDWPALLARMKAQPDQANYASPGPGTVPHFIGEMISREVGVPMTHIPYRGTGPAMNDLLGGRFPMMVDTLWVDRHKSGQIKIVAVTGERRYRDLPEVPTLKELGVNIVVDQYFALMGPAGLPAAVAARLGEATREALAAREVQDALYAIGQEPAWLNGKDLSALQAANLAAWEQPVKRSGYVPE
jgi:tripartite-type tricarboxylate transporter receptor subunit TctC